MLRHEKRRRCLADRQRAPCSKVSARAGPSGGNETANPPGTRGQKPESLLSRPHPKSPPAGQVGQSEVGNLGSLGSLDGLAMLAFLMQRGAPVPPAERTRNLAHSARRHHINKQVSARWQSHRIPLLLAIRRPRLDPALADGTIIRKKLRNLPKARFCV